MTTPGISNHSWGERCPSVLPNSTLNIRCDADAGHRGAHYASRPGTPGRHTWADQLPKLDQTARIATALEEANRLKRLELRLRCFEIGMDYDDDDGANGGALEEFVTSIIDALEGP